MIKHAPKWGRRSGGALNLLLRSLPPLFALALIGFLTYYTVYHNANESPLLVFAAVYINAQIFCNWVQFLRHSCVVRASKKNFPGYFHRFPSLANSKDPRSINTDYEQARKVWKECDVCDMHVPTATYHCSLCRACVSVPDHHCYFLGHCAGRFNQRFFLVFAFYAAIGSAIGAYTLVQVMGYYRNYLNSEVIYYLLPFTTTAYLAGWNGVQPFEMLYVALIDFGAGASLFSGALFFWGLQKIAKGNAAKEAKKKVRCEDDIQLTAGQRFELVFGSCGLMHFLVPFVPYDGPPVDEGYRRIITYNSDYVRNGMVRNDEEVTNNHVV